VRYTRESGFAPRLTVTLRPVFRVVEHLLDNLG